MEVTEQVNSEAVAVIWGEGSGSTLIVAEPVTALVHVGLETLVSVAMILAVTLPRTRLPLPFASSATLETGPPLRLKLIEPLAGPLKLMVDDSPEHTVEGLTDTDAVSAGGCCTVIDVVLVHPFASETV
jgi:hypothetical protein